MIRTITVSDKGHDLLTAALADYNGARVQPTTIACRAVAKTPRQRCEGFFAIYKIAAALCFKCTQCGRWVETAQKPSSPSDKDYEFKSEEAEDLYYHKRDHGLV